MKITLKIELNFESWFEPEREPKNKEEWANFFLKHLVTESSVIGNNDGTNKDLVCLDDYSIKCIDLHK